MPETTQVVDLMHDNHTWDTDWSLWKKPMSATKQQHWDLRLENLHLGNNYYLAIGNNQNYSYK